MSYASHVSPAARRPPIMIMSSKNALHFGLTAGRSLQNKTRQEANSSLGEREYLLVPRPQAVAESSRYIAKSCSLQSLPISELEMGQCSPCPTGRHPVAGGACSCRLLTALGLSRAHSRRAMLVHGGQGSTHGMATKIKHCASLF